MNYVVGLPDETSRLMDIAVRFGTAYIYTLYY